MNLFPIASWHSTFIDLTRKSVSNWKQIHLKYEQAFFTKNLTVENSIHGWRNLIHGLKCHPWMSSMDGEMSSINGEMSSTDGEMSSMDGSVIRGCHSWMTLPSIDFIHGIHGWHPWMKTTDDGHGRSIRHFSVVLQKETRDEWWYFLEWW